MNDVQLMKQIRKYAERLLVQKMENIRPIEIHPTFIHICKNIDKLNLNESKINFVLELKELFSKLQSIWTDMKDYWSEKDKEIKQEMFENLDKYLSKFNKIEGSKVSKDSLKAEQDSLAEGKEANIKARGANIIAFVALGIAIVSIFVTLLLYFRF